MTFTDENQDDFWKTALQPLHPGITPSPALVERMNALAAEAEMVAAPPQSGFSARRRAAVSLAAAAFSVAIITAGAIIGPRIALANTLRAVASNLREAQGIHSKVTFFRQGKATLSQEIWQAGDRWRMESEQNGSRSVEIHADGKFWSYDPVRRIASYQKQAQPYPLFQSFKSLRAWAQQALDNGQGESLGTVTRGGIRLQRVAVPSPVQKTPFSAPTPGRTVFTIDPARMLPTLTEQQICENGLWTTVAQAELDLENGISPTQFTIRDKNVSIYDVDALGAQAGSRFARPLAQKRFATCTITLRDVQVNRDGDLFILYTDGSTREKSRPTFIDGTQIRDDRKTQYTNTIGALEPYMYIENPRGGRGMTVNGLPMQGACITPLTPALPSSPLPRRITLTISFDEQHAKKWFHGSAQFTVPVRRTSTLLPGYAADLAILQLAGGDPKRFRLEREAGRRMYYENACDWAGMVQSTSRALQQGVKDVYTYLHRAAAFKELGKPDQARAALAAARKADDNGSYDDRITGAEDALRKPR